MTSLKIFIAMVFAMSINLVSFNFSGSKSDNGYAITTGDIREETDALVTKKLVEPYKTAVKIDVDPDEMFSRCPSGYRTPINQLAKSTTEYSQGKFLFYSGCSGNEICWFRARLSDGAVEVLGDDGKTYVAADTWLNSATASIK